MQRPTVFGWPLHYRESFIQVQQWAVAKVSKRRVACGAPLKRPWREC